MGVVNRLVYDGNGNITKAVPYSLMLRIKVSGSQDLLPQTKTMWRLSQTQRATESCMTGM